MFYVNIVKSDCELGESITCKADKMRLSELHRALKNSRIKVIKDI